jgi:hypothetical protein
METACGDFPWSRSGSGVVAMHPLAQLPILSASLKEEGFGILTEIDV